MASDVVFSDPQFRVAIEQEITHPLVRSQDASAAAHCKTRAPTGAHQSMSAQDHNPIDGHLQGTVTMGEGADFTSEFVLTLAEMLGVDADSLPPLDREIDTDVLSLLFRTESRRGKRFTGTLTFSYASHTIVLDAESEVGHDESRRDIYLEVYPEYTR